MRSAPRTGLSPEWWEPGVDEVFTDLISHDDDFVRAEFASLTRASWPVRRPASSSSRETGDQPS